MRNPKFIIQKPKKSFPPSINGRPWRGLYMQDVVFINLFCQGIFHFRWPYEKDRLQRTAIELLFFNLYYLVVKLVIYARGVTAKRSINIGPLRDKRFKSWNDSEFSDMVSEILMLNTRHSTKLKSLRHSLSPFYSDF